MFILICKNFLQCFQCTYASLRACPEPWLAPSPTVRRRRPTVSVLAAAVAERRPLARLRSQASTVAIKADLLVGARRLVQLDRVEQPVRVLEGVRVASRERTARALLAAAGRNGAPRALVDHGAAEIRVDDDGLLLEVVGDVAAAVGRLEV